MSRLDRLTHRARSEDDTVGDLKKLVAAQTGQQYTAVHVERCYNDADVDGSGLIDLNELLLYRERAAQQGRRR